jgi:hypothetical protein
VTVSTAAPIKRALVVALRGNATLHSGLTGGIHEGFAPTKVEYPLLTYQLIYDPYLYQWGSVMHEAGLDIRVIGPDSVVANNLDALVLSTLQDAALAVDGQTTLYCRRIAGFGDPDVDEEGRKIYIVGSTYEVWTNASL